MFGRPTSSQIASASAAARLFRLTYGLTYCGGISLTSWPSRVTREPVMRARDASIPIMQAGNLPKNSSSWLRANRRRRLARNIDAVNLRPTWRDQDQRGQNSWRTSWQDG